MNRFNATLAERVPAVEVTEAGNIHTILEPGTKVCVEVAKFEWLGQSGLYSEITVPSLDHRRFRVKYHLLYQATRKSQEKSRKIA
jgi:hypothetical protein